MTKEMLEKIRELIQMEIEAAASYEDEGGYRVYNRKAEKEADKIFQELVELLKGGGK